MVAIEFDDDPTTTEVKRAIDRIRQAGNIPQGITGGRSFAYDDETETLRVNFDHLRKVLFEHRMFEEAEGFAPIQIELLRIIDAGPDRMAFSEIKAKVTENPNIEGKKDTSTLHYHLRKLREKNLVEHNHNQYTYIGP